MSYYLQVDKADAQEVASNKGWGDFRRWVDTLDASDYNQIVHLVEWGWSQKPSLLTSQLDDALANHPPRRDDVQTTADGLLALLEENTSAQVVTVTDGLSG